MRISDWSSDVCSSDLLDHYHRLMLVMIKLAAVQDAIISHVHQEHLRALSKMRLGQQTERLRSEVAGTVEEASLKSADLRIRVDGRSEERRVGKECVSTCKCGWSRCI